MSTFYNLPVDGIHEDVEFVQDPEWRVHVLPKAEDQRHRAEGLLATRESLDVTNAALHSLVIRIRTLGVLQTTRGVIKISFLILVSCFNRNFEWRKSAELY